MGSNDGVLEIFHEMAKGFMEEYKTDPYTAMKMVGLFAEACAGSDTREGADQRFQGLISRAWEDQEPWATGLMGHFIDKMYPDALRIVRVCQDNHKDPRSALVAVYPIDSRMAGELVGYLNEKNPDHDD